MKETSVGQDGALTDLATPRGPLNREVDGATLLTPRHAARTQQAHGAPGEAASEVAEKEGLVAALEKDNRELKVKHAKATEMSQALLQELEALKDGPAGAALDAVLESIGRERWLAEMDDGEGSEVRDANVEELRAHAHEYDRLNPAGKLPGFLQDVALVSDTDAYDGAEDAVKLMTLHSAKGLEFDHVFIAGCEEEILPHARAVEGICKVPTS